MVFARIRSLHLSIPSLSYKDIVGHTLDIRIGSREGDPAGLLVHLDEPLKPADMENLCLLQLYTTQCEWSRSELDDVVLLLRREGDTHGPVYRRLGAGTLAQPRPPPFIPWSTSLLGSLAEPSMDAIAPYELPLRTERGFFDIERYEEVEFI